MTKKSLAAFMMVRLWQEISSSESESRLFFKNNERITDICGL